ncbi:hypothetical protein U3516DRAFT_892615 [Neocallimastix sp. 'constans']
MSIFIVTFLYFIFLMSFFDVMFFMSFFSCLMSKTIKLYKRAYLFPFVLFSNVKNYFEWLIFFRYSFFFSSVTFSVIILMS